MQLIRRVMLSTLVMAGLVACAGHDIKAGDRATQPLVTAEYVDLDRFMGRWYVIANIPYWGERGYVGSYVEYVRREDGDIDDFYYGRKKSFDHPVKKTHLKDWVVNKKTNAEWRASPFWPLSFPYLILYVDPDYQMALIGYPDRSLGWIFSRSPAIPDATLQALYEKLQAQGYDVQMFRRVAQAPGDLGRDGFQ